MKVSGEVILSAENSGKPYLGGQGSAPKPAGGAHSAPPDPQADGVVTSPQGVVVLAALCPSTPSAISALVLDFLPFAEVLYRNEKSWTCP